MKTKTILIIVVVLISINTYCQPTPPKTHGNNVTTGQTQSAPIGTSTTLLLGLATIYTSARIYVKRKREENNDNEL
jgi:hypothetical protein